MTHHIIPLGELHRHLDTTLCPCKPFVGSPEEDGMTYIVHYHLEPSEEELEEIEEEEYFNEDGSIDVSMN